MATPKPSVKILVAGDTAGNFKQLFSRVSQVNKKNGPFEMLLCVGDFFGSSDEEWQHCLKGTLKAPIPTYILGPNHYDHIKHYSSENGEDLCENVTYLGKKGIFNSSSGLRLAYLSGLESSKNQEDHVHFSAETVEKLELSLTSSRNFKGVDILLTSPWPEGVTMYAKSPTGKDFSTIGSSLISHLAKVTWPRYHFCSREEVYYERLPYRNHQVLLENARQVTRFIALAKVGNPQKEKWLYAFSITPMISLETQELIKQPLDVTENPYSNLKVKQKSKAALKMDEMPQQYFFDRSSSEKKGYKRQKNDDYESNKKKFQKKPMQPTGPCWFCLASPEVEKHLVVSVGNHTYLAIAKGGLVPEHVLILPIGHYQSTTDLSEEATDEIDKFKSALKKCFSAQDMDVVFFERNYKTQHLQIQVVPIPKKVTCILKQTFFEYAEEQMINLDEIPKFSDLGQIISPGRPYFYVELPTGEKLLHQISKHFPLQFGREVIASEPLLNIPERAEWKQCTNSKEEEAKFAQDFRKIFENYDFTL